MSVTKNDAGFRGRQWESDVTGQQYATKTEALVDEAYEAGKAAAFKSMFPEPRHHEPVARRAHTIRGVSSEDRTEWNRIAFYGVPHDFDCPGCHDTPFTASPRSETYWSS